MKRSSLAITMLIFLVSMVLLNTSCSPQHEEIPSLYYQGQIDGIVPFESGYTTKATIITPKGNIPLDSSSIHILRDNTITQITETNCPFSWNYVTRITVNINGEYWLYKTTKSTLVYILSEKPILTWDNTLSPSLK